MADYALCARLVDSMTKEHELLVHFKSTEDEMTDAIRRKDVSKLETCIKAMAELSDVLVAIEEKRNTVFSTVREEFGEPPDASFYQVIVHLPTDMRDQLSELYRSLKITVVGIQAVTSCIDEQVRSATGTMQQILNELFPHRKGNMYSREGRRRETDSNPLVVNQRL